MCRALGMSMAAVDTHVRRICRQEGVRNRHELARKLGWAHPQPLNQEERARERRERVLPLVLAGKSFGEIMAALSMEYEVVERTMKALYREHGVRGFGRECRRLLVEKLKGVVL
jgi:DNA-binding CsgD family transcriptional regulator